MKRTVLLGAGASRSVSYASDMPVSSFLDRDFFELLQRLEVPNKHQKQSVDFVIKLALASSGELWSSMERLFYTLYVQATLRKVLLPNQASGPDVGELLDHFTRAAQVLLRQAHGTRTCTFHSRMFANLSGNDGIMTFNYDLVPERALRPSYENCPFADWLYGFASRPDGCGNVPTLYKLHGSVNWKPLTSTTFKVRQKTWADFDQKPGYTAEPFSILLPYWDKRVEDPPWSNIWHRAARDLRDTTHLVVWGYSLPLSDLKAQELLKMTLRAKGSPLLAVCVIDPAQDIRDRWRRSFLHQKFWQYPDIEKFLWDPPQWYDLSRGRDSA